MEVKKYLSSQKGQAILLSVIIMGSILLSVTTIAGYLSIQKIRVSRDIVNSGKAIYAADAGIEYRLYEEFVGPTGNPPSFSNGASVQTSVVPNGNITTIRSVGSAGNSSRAFKLDIGF